MMLKPQLALIKNFQPTHLKFSANYQDQLDLGTLEFIIRQYKILPTPVNLVIYCLTFLYHLLGLLCFAKLPKNLSNKQHEKLCSIFSYLPLGKTYLRLLRSLTYLYFFEQDVVLKETYKNV